MSIRVTGSSGWQAGYSGALTDPTCQPPTKPRTVDAVCLEENAYAETDNSDRFGLGGGRVFLLCSRRSGNDFAAEDNGSCAAPFHLDSIHNTEIPTDTLEVDEPAVHVMPLQEAVAKAQPLGSDWTLLFARVGNPLEQTGEYPVF